MFVDNGKIVNYYRSNVPLIDASYCAYFNWICFGLLIIIQSIRLRFSYSFSDKVKLFNLILCLSFDAILYIYCEVKHLTNYWNALLRMTFCIIYQYPTYFYPLGKNSGAL